MRKLQPVPGIPALRIMGSTVVVADLHVGLEGEMADRGVDVARAERQMLQELASLASLEQRLIILGDLRHRIGYTRKSTLPEFMSTLLDYFETVDIVPGNHDSLISRAMPHRIRVHSMGGFAEEGMGFIHGHAWPSAAVMSAGTLLMGHLHPAVAFRDSLGNLYIEKCWLRAPFRKRDPTGRYSSLPAEVVVLPAFNPLLTGTPVNRGSGDMGPVFSEGLVLKNRGRIYLLDGTYLGTVSMNLLKSAA